MQTTERQQVFKGGAFYELPAQAREYYSMNQGGIVYRYVQATQESDGKRAGHGWLISEQGERHPNQGQAMPIERSKMTPVPDNFQFQTGPRKPGVDNEGGFDPNTQQPKDSTKTQTKEKPLSQQAPNPTTSADPKTRQKQDKQKVKTHLFGMKTSNRWSYVGLTLLVIGMFLYEVWDGLGALFTFGGMAIILLHQLSRFAIVRNRPWFVIQVVLVVLFSATFLFLVGVSAHAYTTAGLKLSGPQHVFTVPDAFALEDIVRRIPYGVGWIIWKILLALSNTFNKVGLTAIGTAFFFIFLIVQTIQIAPVFIHRIPRFKAFVYNQLKRFNAEINDQLDGNGEDDTELQAQLREDLINHQERWLINLGLAQKISFGVDAAVCIIATPPFVGTFVKVPSPGNIGTLLCTVCLFYLVARMACYCYNALSVVCGEAPEHIIKRRLERRRQQQA